MRQACSFSGQNEWYEPFAVSVVLFIVGLGIVGALANIVWLFVFPVDEQRWKEQGSTAAASIWK